ncbi:hypothetical protein RRG08_066107 [Elysia crispata]|uniref:Uncharacterized protein n=1 Tax=Elysia crispata TaxID=231223 RepID=A0AAE1DG60_9GAST|nr:hypothetical protein RRG08_066107 [Elysia crispata]
MLVSVRYYIPEVEAFTGRPPNLAGRPVQEWKLRSGHENQIWNFLKFCFPQPQSRTDVREWIEGNLQIGGSYSGKPIVPPLCLVPVPPLCLVPDSDGWRAPALSSDRRQSRVLSLDRSLESGEATSASPLTISRRLALLV